MDYFEERDAYQKGYDGLPFSAADPGYGQWLQGRNDRYRDEQYRTETYTGGRYRAVVRRDDLTLGDYLTTLIVAPLFVGLIVLVVSLLFGWDYMRWAVISGAATFAVILGYGLLIVAVRLLPLAILVAIVWFVLHLVGIAPGLPW